MISRRPTGFLTMAALSLCLLPVGSMAQQKTLKEQLVGTWSLVAFEGTGADGKKTAVFGAQPKGILMMDAGGHYAMVLTDPGRPKWKSNLRPELTTEEFAAAAKGLVAQFGSWSVDEGSKVLTRRVERHAQSGLRGLRVLTPRGDAPNGGQKLSDDSRLFLPPPGKRRDQYGHWRIVSGQAGSKSFS
jgi:hypothetical protein